jgi:hypothetical protein
MLSWVLFKEANLTGQSALLVEGIGAMIVLLTAGFVVPAHRIVGAVNTVTSAAIRAASRCGVPRCLWVSCCGIDSGNGDYAAVLTNGARRESALELPCPPRSREQGGRGLDEPLLSPQSATLIGSMDRREDSSVTRVPSGEDVATTPATRTTNSAVRRDVCCDFKDTGACEFGDRCHFLHAVVDGSRV